MLTSTTLVRSIRTRAGASQRDLGHLANTSGPTIAAYELGTKEARLSTLERLAEAAGQRVVVTLEPRESGARARGRRSLRSRALADAMASVLPGHWDTALALAEQNLETMEAAVGDNRAQLVLERWRQILGRGPAAAVAALRDDSEAGDELRQMHPFAGLLTDHERRLVLAAANAWASAR